MTKLAHKQSIFRQVLILVPVPLFVGTLVLSFLQKLFAKTEDLWQEAPTQLIARYGIRHLFQAAQNPGKDISVAHRNQKDFAAQMSAFAVQSRILK